MPGSTRLKAVKRSASRDKKPLLLGINHPIFAAVTRPWPVPVPEY
jgi:hypothetical protein